MYIFHLHNSVSKQFFNHPAWFSDQCTFSQFDRKQSKQVCLLKKNHLSSSRYYWIPTFENCVGIFMLKKVTTVASFRRVVLSLAFAFSFFDNPFSGNLCVMVSKRNFLCWYVNPPILNHDLCFNFNHILSLMYTARKHSKSTFISFPLRNNMADIFQVSKPDKICSLHLVRSWG